MHIYTHKVWVSQTINFLSESYYKQAYFCCSPVLPLFMGCPWGGTGNHEPESGTTNRFWISWTESKSQPLDPWIHGSMVPWLHGSIDPWSMNPWIPWIHASKDPWIHGPCAHGYMDPWIHGSMYPWLHGFTDPWIHGSMEGRGWSYVSSLLHTMPFHSLAKSGTLSMSGEMLLVVSTGIL